MVDETTLHPSTTRAMREAWATNPAQLARRTVDHLARFLQHQHPGAITAGQYAKDSGHYLRNRSIGGATGAPMGTVR